MNNVDLTSLEAKFREAYDRDGAMEILLGIGLFFGGAVLNHAMRTAFAGIMPAFLVVIGKAWKKRITYPRIGYAKLPAVNQTRNNALTLIVITIAAVSSLFFIGYLAGKTGFENKAIEMKPYTGLFVCAFIALLVSGIGIVRRNPVLYGVALFLLILAFLAHAGFMTNGDAVTFTGIASMIAGIVRMILFIRSNPRLDGETSGE